MNQLYMYICPLPLEPASFLSPRPTGLGCYEPLFEFPESYSKSPLAICFIYCNVYFHVALSIYPLSPSPLPPLHKSVLCVCVFIASLQVISSVWGCVFLARVPQKWCLFSDVSDVEASDFNLITYNFDHLLKVMSAKFFRWKVIHFHCTINILLGESLKFGRLSIL